MKKQTTAEKCANDSLGRTMTNYNMRKIVRKILILFVLISLLTSVVYADMSYSNLQNKKLIALTFDDGPGPYTDELLDILKSKDVKVTFFVLGNRAETYKTVLKRAYDEGHQIALHSYNHPNFNKLSDNEILKQLEDCIFAVDNAIGVHKSDYRFRPPYGNHNSKMLQLTEMACINWSIDSKDWSYKDAAKTCNQIVSDAFDGAIVLQHDIHKSSVDAVGNIIDRLRAKGYEFVTVDELFRAKGTALEPGKLYYKAANRPLYDASSALHLSDGSIVNDASVSDWYAEYIRDVLDNGLMQLEDGSFFPGRAMNRLEVVELLYRLAGSPPVPAQQAQGNISENAEIASTAAFTDIADNNAVQWAYDNGITKGYEDKSFRPGLNVSRQEFATFFCRFEAYMGNMTAAEYDLSIFSDSAKLASYAAEPFKFMLEKGILNGTGNGKLSPKGILTRAQAAAVASRYLNSLPSEAEP